KFERVGGSKTIHVDVRVLAATNKNLEKEIEAGTFRADLFYRLNVVPIMVPSLSARHQDIPLLAGDFVRLFRKKGMGAKKISDEAMQILIQHSWPGNIRELRNVIERLIIMSPEPTIEANDVALFLLPGNAPQAQPAEQTVRLQYQDLTFKEARKQFEFDYLKTKLMENDGNVSQTAEQVGMERSHLHKKVKALGIEF
ncbi:MAG: sigma-54-dependent Fis family transcriptional regulator, partial [Desulfobulbaceae bacterium]|nr:sigma-54-dependent Fis family transcriptional regulator [Desulfobulbaceae bacterium]